MSFPENNDAESAIRQAIRAKRERKTGTGEDRAALEAALIADIEAFDLDAAERRARREESTGSIAGMSDPTLVFPEIVPTGGQHHPGAAAASLLPSSDARPAGEGNLLDELRQQAERRQRAEHSAQTERNVVNDAIDQALKHLFFYLHELVQQLNILKPDVARQYLLVDQHVLTSLSWQEGFADYRTQSQSAGALVELVSFSYRLLGAPLPPIERHGSSVERFRSTLFDFGLPFSCKEFKNERSYIERAEFTIASEISVSARWRADFARGVVMLETRNLERLGSTVYTLRPQALDQSLLEEFGRLVLSQPQGFRDLARR